MGFGIRRLTKTLRPVRGRKDTEKRHRRTQSSEVTLIAATHSQHPAPSNPNTSPHPRLRKLRVVYHARASMGALNTSSLALPTHSPKRRLLHRDHLPGDGFPDDHRPECCSRYRDLGMMAQWARWGANPEQKTRAAPDLYREKLRVDADREAARARTTRARTRRAVRSEFV